MRLAFIKETGVYFASTLFQILMNPLSLYFYSQVLSKGDYGILALINVTAGLMVIFSNWGLVNGMVRFIGEPQEDRNGLIGAAYYGSLAAGGIVFLIFLFCSPFFTRLILGANNYRGIFIIGVSSAVFLMISQVFQNLLRMEKKSVWYVTFDITNVLLNFCLGFYFIFILRLGVWGFVLSAFITQAIFAAIQYLYLRSNYNIYFSWVHFKKLIAYGAPFTIIFIAGWIIDWSNRYILKGFVTIGDIGLYSVAFSYGVIMQALVNPFVLANLPYQFDYYRQGQYSQKTGNMVLNYVAFYMGVALVLTMLATPYFTYLTPRQFHSAINIAPWIALAYAWRGLFNIFCFCNTLTGNAKAQFFIEVGAALLTIVLNLIFIPLWGLYGTVFATMVSWLYMLGFAFVHNQKVLPIQLPRKSMITLIVFGLTCFGAMVFFNSCSIWPLGIFILFLYILFVHFKVLPLGPLAGIVRQIFAKSCQIPSL